MLVATHRANATPVNFQRQHSFESALLGKPLKGNARRGAYLYLSSKVHPGREKGDARRVASIKSAASIAPSSGTPGGFSRGANVRELSGNFTERVMPNSTDEKGRRMLKSFETANRVHRLR